MSPSPGLGAAYQMGQTPGREEPDGADSMTRGAIADPLKDRLQRATESKVAVPATSAGAAARVGLAHGPFLARDEDEALLRAVPEGVTPRRVLLLTTYEVALARVAGDPDRDLSRRPDLLRWTYERAGALLPSMPPSEWTFDTGDTAWEEVVDTLSAALLGSSGPGGADRTA